jgi:hypothetical protein
MWHQRSQVVGQKGFGFEISADIFGNVKRIEYWIGVHPVPVSVGLTVRTVPGSYCTFPSTPEFRSGKNQGQRSENVPNRNSTRCPSDYICGRFLVRLTESGSFDIESRDSEVTSKANEY